ncbi:MAG: type 3 dihydrofolate reductase [Betaproteobacteria bacterium]|nr:type 3 dihydrofolate reductase [Betaproteobacteria bacterium]
MHVNLIAAVAENGVIGQGNSMPWHLPADFAWFKHHTLGHAVVMGRKTFESIGKALPGRRNIVVTRNPAWHAPGCESVPSLARALEVCAGEEEVFVIGGGELYAAALPLAQRLYLTTVASRPAGDTRFPEWAAHEWRAIHDASHAADERNVHAMRFRILERIEASR